MRRRNLQDPTPQPMTAARTLARFRVIAPGLSFLLVFLAAAPDPAQNLPLRTANAEVQMDAISAKLVSVAAGLPGEAANGKDDKQGKKSA